LRALILTGAGEKVFSAGADLEEAHAGLATAPVWEEVSGNLAALECLTIAALNGTLAGGAFGMALACDIRIAVPNARFFYPVAKLGFLPQPSDPGRMRALMGPARTKLLLLGGQKFTADEALRLWPDRPHRRARAPDGRRARHRRRCAGREARRPARHQGDERGVVWASAVSIRAARRGSSNGNPAAVSRPM
jgi:hypothetical protein